MLPHGGAWRCLALRHRVDLALSGGARPVLAETERSGAVSPTAATRGLAFRRPKATPIYIGVLSDRLARPDHLLGFFRGKCFEPARPAFAPERQALRHRCALWQDSVEGGIMPARRKVDGAVVKIVAIDQAGQRRERQVGAIDRVGEEDRVARRRLDGPEKIGRASCRERCRL